jgi:hypothetical protein
MACSGAALALFSVKRVAGDGNCLFWSLTIILENDKAIMIY